MEAITPSLEKMKKDVSEGVVRSVSGQMKGSFKSEFQNTLLPGVQASVRSVFDQIHGTLESGIESDIRITQFIFVSVLFRCLLVCYLQCGDIL